MSAPSKSALAWAVEMLANVVLDRDETIAALNAKINRLEAELREADGLIEWHANEALR